MASNRNIRQLTNKNRSVNEQTISQHIPINKGNRSIQGKITSTNWSNFAADDEKFLSDIADRADHLEKIVCDHDRGIRLLIERVDAFKKQKLGMSNQKILVKADILMSDLWSKLHATSDRSILSVQGVQAEVKTPEESLNVKRIKSALSESTTGHGLGIDTDLSSHITQMRPLSQADSRTINLLLLGSEGNGKSATGNSILGKEAFKRDSSASTTSTSLTPNIVKGNTEVEGLSVNVIDGPSIHHAEIDQDFLDNILTSIKESLELCDYAFNTILIVLKMGIRFTKQEAETIKLIKSLLGENVIKDYGICVVTHGDNFERDVEDAAEDGETLTFDSWCRDQSGDVKNLFDECKFRCVLFDNKTKDLNKKQSQRIKLLKNVDRKKRYSMEEFLKAEGVKELKFKASLPKLEQETKALIDEIYLQVQEIDVNTKDDPDLYKLRMEPLLVKLQTQKNSIEVFGQSSSLASLMCQQISVLQYNINSKIIQQESLALSKKQITLSPNRAGSAPANIELLSYGTRREFNINMHQSVSNDTVMFRESQNFQQSEVRKVQNVENLSNAVDEKWRMIRLKYKK